MQKSLILKAFTLTFTLTTCNLLTSCWYQREIAPPVQQSSVYYRPVSMSRSQLEQSISVKEPQDLVNPGKIYLYGNYILVNEKYKGIHLIDNTNPKNPTKIAFLSIAGNLDMAIRQNVLYTDNAVDLVSINFEELINKRLKILSRLKNNLPLLSSPDGQMYYGYNDNSIIVDWKK